ncbi:MAG: hypothetical protein R3F56_01945 [Planctomycetota bacterium]
MRVFFALVSSAMLSACGTPSEPAPPSGGSPGERPPTDAAPYDGPALTATIETEESHPPRYTLVLEVNCPTGGYTLNLAGFDEKTTPREVRYVLTSPASDELVIQAFQTHTERVELGSERTPVRVLICQRQRRSASAATQPFRLAATVAPK